MIKSNPMRLKEKIEDVKILIVSGKWVIETHESFLESDFDLLKIMSDTQLATFCSEIGLISKSEKCMDCGTVLETLNIKDGRHPFFRCSKNSCKRTRISAVKNSVFELTKLKFIQVLKLLYNFSCRRSVSDSSQTLDISKTTVVDFFKFFRSAIFKFMQDHSMKLGGDGIVVHFDETPITHRHGLLGRTQRSNTVWVVGAVDIHSRRCFMKFLPSRSRDDLFSFFNEWILPGSVVHTDSHRSYLTLSSLGFTHFMVNHSRNLVSPDGIHTNWIEGLFGCVKKLIRKYDAGFTTVDNLELYLAEFCFRYSFESFNRKTAFLKLISILKYTKRSLDD